MFIVNTTYYMAITRKISGDYTRIKVVFTQVATFLHIICRKAHIICNNLLFNV